MSAIRQKFRPKHQLLILKCYPHFQKNAVEIKPNSSELSYLLYYASTRRSKLQKVGVFLEKKTGSDVRRGRHGDVQVTLQILSALIEKCPRDLPLYSGSILNILHSILSSRDINLVEDSVTTFSTFCSFYDSATFAKEQTNSRHFEDILLSYASFAAKDTATTVKGRQPSVPIAIRFREAGLSAIKNLVSAESFAGYNGKHLGLILPAILQNIYSDRPNHISLLQYRDTERQQYEKEQGHKRRQSVNIARAADSADVNPTTIAGSTADSDQRAEEEVGVLALNCLRALFSADNRPQLRRATQVAIDFAKHRATKSKQTQVGHDLQQNHRSWPAELFETICHWPAPQERFVVLLTVVEGLTKGSIREDDLADQLVLVDVVDWLLSSSINFIGLSVLDVLLGLIQHILLLLQLGGPSTDAGSRAGQSTPGSSPSKRNTLSVKNSETDIPNGSRSQETVEKPSASRLELLEKLEKCIGDLATHIYYSDQVGDMISALLSRLKPSQPLNISTAVQAVEDPEGAVNSIASGTNMQDRGQADAFFSFDTALVIALKAARRVLTVANSARRDGGVAVGRNRVNISVWEGTQWLLRDPDGRVRKAFMEAFFTWLTYEPEKNDMRLPESCTVEKAPKRESDGLQVNNLAKRAMSNASQKVKAQIKARSTFLQLLHLAIFENATHHAQSEPDILLLHLLQTTLIQKLGINSVSISLPMIFSLQEEIPNLETSVEKMSVGSLVHGYFWALSETFEFENSAVGRQIHGEIVRRSSKGFWIKNLQIPALPLDKIGSLEHPTVPKLPAHVDTQSESLRPFDAREDLVDTIFETYSNTAFSQPSSPPTSPGRMSSSATFVSRRTASNGSNVNVERSLPLSLKEQMMTPWSKESCISAVEKESTRAVSINGSRSGPGSATRQLLSPHGNPVMNGSHETHIGAKSVGISPIGPELASKPQTSPRSSPTPLSNTSLHSVIRVDELKRILAGESVGTAVPEPHVVDMAHDTTSESLVSAPFTASETSLPLDQVGQAVGGVSPVSTSENSAKHQANDAKNADHVEDDDIPPVPMLPANIRAPPLGTPLGAGIEKQLGVVGNYFPTDVPGQALRISGYGNFGKAGGVGLDGGKLDVRTLLSGIETNSARRPTSSMGTPPY